MTKGLPGPISGTLVGVDGETMNVRQAARTLDVTQSRVRQMLGKGDLEGEHDERGSWLVYTRSVNAMKEQRQGQSEVSGRPEEVNDLYETIGRLRERAENRLELTERAESTMQAERETLLESLRRERERADRYEEEAARLRDDLADCRRERDLMAERTRGFWSRLFGGEENR